MFAAILKWFVGGGISALAGPLERAYKAKLEAQNDAARLEADKQIAFYQGQIDLAQTAGSDPWWSPRSIMGWCAAIYVGKIVVWDTVLGLGVTPDPGTQVTGIVMTIIGFYYGSRALTEASSLVVASFMRRR